jgi:hypothetical protein
MSKNRADFLRDRLAVVDAALAVASDKVTHRVQVKLAAAKAAFAERYGEMPEESREVIRRISPAFDETEGAIAECPACGCKGIAVGRHSLDDYVRYDEEGEPQGLAWLKFTPVTFSCATCGLRLASQAELAAAGLPKEWDLPDLDVGDYLLREWDDEG